MHLLRCKGQTLRYLPGLGNPLLCIMVLYLWEGSKKGQCCLFSTRSVFSHFPHYPEANWALLVLIPGWVVYALGPRMSLQWTLLRDWQFILPPQPPLVFTARSYKALFFQCWNLWSGLGLGCWDGLLPRCPSHCLFLEGEGKEGRKRGRETSVCGCFSHAPHWGPGLQPRHVP